MVRLPVIAAAVLAIAAPAPLICATTTPASAQEWHDGGHDMNVDLRDLLMDRIRTRQDLRDLIADLLQDRQDRRGFMREHMRQWHDRDDQDEGGWRERLRERVSERHHGGEEGECYFLTRTLRDEDGDLFVLVRRRICRD
jgi:hypothetical protein